MKKIFLIPAILTLVACGDNGQNPELLKGKNFISNQEGTDITLSFDASEMRVHGKIVNLYNGSYTAEDNNIKFGEIVTTMMMGPMDAMDVEQEYLGFMSSVEKYELSTDGRLTLINGDGTEIVFQEIESEQPTETK